MPCINKIFLTILGATAPTMPLILTCTYLHLFSILLLELEFIGVKMATIEFNYIITTTLIILVMSAAELTSSTNVWVVVMVGVIVVVVVVVAAVTATG